MEPEADVVQELVDTLPLLISLEYLGLGGVENLLELHTALTPAFCTLSTLRRIDFTGANNKACPLLVGLHAPLISASIDFRASDGQMLWDHLDVDEWERYHPTTLLNNFSSTLEELECVSWYTTPDNAVMPTQVYPNMQKLSIQLHQFPLCIEAFIRAFPNLTDLHVGAEDHRGDVETIHESHTANVAQQQALNSCGTWAHLEHFYGCLVDLHAIGLTSPIQRLTLDDRLDEGPQTEMLATMLRYARPSHLKVDAIAGTFLGDNTQGFISMLRDESASNLMNLDICIYFGKDDREKDLSAVIDNLVSALTSLPLKFLELEFVTSDLNPTPPEPTLTPAELSLQSLNMDALVARLESMQSLQAAHVLLRSSHHGGDSDWKGYERTITKGTECLAGWEQWESWVFGKNGLVLSQS
ncbi:hypothetical protein GSI_07317 [Ganoderma sinense ZZ0214-1]|uniref:F-box domain-containing protein n=1 Tax=Ganoderma sinense ZZ0214-1 TaxID=1077348 RepID=A0A2G8SA19_9APHY|nr:hypothetical protein GSI_07317 [Ganoderma sinense ZZ0214-1]